jgi:GH24 family phage-related lysozyme (muramidase)
MANSAPITLAQLFRYFQNLPHQAAAIVELEADIRANGYTRALRRDRPWFATWSQDGKQPEPATPAQPAWLTLALKLIQEFEGCAKRLPNGTLQAYPDPGTGGEPWTIGWGSTRINGRQVQPGQIITQATADSELLTQVGQFQTHLAATIPGWGQLKAQQKAALVSFAWNCGADFYGHPEFGTITRALRDRAYANVPDAMKLYRNPGTNVEAGLRRRRLAEGAMWDGRG